MYTLNCKGKLLVIDRPLVMGILNVTPDSFHDQNLQEGGDAILQKAFRMIGEGADIIDIGGQSTRPGSERVSASDEMNRVLPIIKKLVQQYPDTVLSIDTYHSEVVVAAVEAGALIVNDISAGNMDEAMLATVAALKVPYVCMHMRGRPETMQRQAVYNDVAREVLDFFIWKIAACKAAGIHDLIIDPGFGFGKTIAHNFTLLKNLDLFKLLDRPILAGLSRKATVYKTLNITSAEALNGTAVLNTMALLNGASLLRVHDVKEAREAIRLHQLYQQA